MRTLVTRGLVAVAAAALLLACHEPRAQRPASQPEPQQPVNAPSIQEPIEQPVAQTPLPSPGPQVPASEPVPQKPFYGPGTTNPEEQHATPLTDAEVLGVAEEANRREVQMADLAMKKAQTPAVKKFAGMMRNMHQKALDSDRRLAHKAKMAPAESDTVKTLKSETDETMKDLRGKEGKDFDRAYMDAQVKAHKDTLDLIDHRLMPAAQSSEVKTMLTNMRAKVAHHITQAEDARSKIDQAPAPGAKKSEAPGKGKAAPGKR
jgi:putative membrane protein